MLGENGMWKCFRTFEKKPHIYRIGNEISGSYSHNEIQIYSCKLQTQGLMPSRVEMTT